LTPAGTAGLDVGTPVRVKSDSRWGSYVGEVGKFTGRRGLNGREVELRFEDGERRWFRSTSLETTTQEDDVCET
jgi:hypothetical protein